MPHNLRWFPVTLLLVSLVGFLDAAYLAAKHFLGLPVVCTFLGGCGTVTTSRFSVIAGIPVALLGACYYLVVFLLVVAYFDTKRNSLMVMAARLTPVGFLASLWFVFVQAFLLKAWCLYCLVSAVTSTILFVVALIYFFQCKKHEPTETS
ncbi:MAG: vitamin K epoxide reductase family protein [bacterium]|nr:vitamin K epoxide reductase family protein [bacterium]